MIGPDPAAVSDRSLPPRRDQIERADARIRLSAWGMRAAEIEPLARELLSDLRVPDGVICDYCQAVERGETFSLLRLVDPVVDDDRPVT